MAMLTMINVLVAGLIAVLSVPLVFRWVPPNAWYGVRTRKTLSDVRLWYSANAFGGWCLLVASGVTVVGSVSLGETGDGGALTLLILVPYGVATVVSLGYVAMQPRPRGPQPEVLGSGLTGKRVLLAMFMLIGVLVAGLAVPMIQGTVEPNAYYGFRTAKTLSGEAVWYPANAYAGWCLLVSGVIIISSALACLPLAGCWSFQRLALVQSAVLILSTLAATAAALVYAARL